MTRFGFFLWLLIPASIISVLAGPAQTNVWMLTPGFTVRELPVRLSNINNLRFQNS